MIQVYLLQEIRDPRQHEDSVFSLLASKVAVKRGDQEKEKQNKVNMGVFVLFCLETRLGPKASTKWA